MDKRKINKLRVVTDGKVDRFSLDGVKTDVKVVSVHDGDTCDVAFYRGDELVRFNCRLKGFDAPELQDKPKGQFARDYLAHLCMGGKPEQFDDSGIWTKKDLQDKLNKNTELVYAEFGKFEIYARLAVTLKTSAKGQSINKLMKKYIQSLESDSSDMDSSDS